MKFQLSNSQLSLLESCERKYYHQYINKTLKDINYVAPDFFAYGNMVHKIFEKIIKTEKDFKITKSSDFEIIWNEVIKEDLYKDLLENNKDGTKLSRGKPVDDLQRQTLKGKMFSYYILFKRWFNNNIISLGKEVIASEITLETDTVKMVVDLIVEIDNKCYIVDFKTHSKMSDADFTAVRLHKDQQMNLYALHGERVLKYLGINLEFGGVAYLEFNKTTHSMSKSDTTFEDFAHRIIEDKGEEALVRFLSINKEHLDGKGYLENFSKQYHKAMVMREKKDFGIQNWNACVDPFSGPCAYFSQCYGHLSNENPFCNTILGTKKATTFEDLFLEGVIL